MHAPRAAPSAPHRQHRPTTAVMFQSNHIALPVSLLHPLICQPRQPQPCNAPASYGSTGTSPLSIACNSGVKMAQAARNSSRRTKCCWSPLHNTGEGTSVSQLLQVQHCAAVPQTPCCISDTTGMKAAANRRLRATTARLRGCRYELSATPRRCRRHGASVPEKCRTRAANSQLKAAMARRQRRWQHARRQPLTARISRRQRPRILSPAAAARYC